MTIWSIGFVGLSLGSKLKTQDLVFYEYNHFVLKMPPLKMMVLRSLCFVTLLAFAVGAVEDYVEGKVARKVFKLTNDNFKTALKDPANPVMLVMFGAYWCGHW